MKDFYHFAMAMIYLKIAGLYVKTNKWRHWIDKSLAHINKVVNL